MHVMLLAYPFEFLPPGDLLLTLGAVTVAVAPAILWGAVRLRAAGRAVQRLRMELAEAREEVAGAYGTLSATREALANARAETASQAAPQAAPAGAASLTAEAVRSEFDALRAEVRRLAADPGRPLRAIARPESVTPH